MSCRFCNARPPFRLTKRSCFAVMPRGLRSHERRLISHVTLIIIIIIMRHTTTTTTTTTIGRRSHTHTDNIHMVIFITEPARRCVFGSVAIHRHFNEMPSRSQRRSTVDTNTHTRTRRPLSLDRSPITVIFLFLI